MFFKNKYLSVSIDDTYIRVSSLYGGIVVMPVTKDNKILLLRSFRAPVNQELLEFPRGFMEAGEEPAGAAARELLEEMNCRAEQFVSMGTIHPDSGFLNSTVHLFIARNTDISQIKLQEAENIHSYELVTYDELFSLCRLNAITDAYTICAAMRAFGVVNPRQLAEKTR